ncbi:uncharacterized protein [Nicotiana tomentosiformis]|uniref:uncharacterized protein n=1 Tax=Nicotiana tomentosiformis TaxID=4098 RepID=UPI00388C5A71
MDLTVTILATGKVNIVADSLNRRSMGSMSYLQLDKCGIAHEIYQLASLRVRLLDSGDTGVTIQYTTKSSLVTKVKERQYEDLVLAHYRDTSPQKENTPFEITGDGVLRYREETKMYHDIRERYLWDGMKKDIAEFVAQCPNYQQATYSAEDYGRLYIREIIQLHGVPISIISDRGAQFTANCWRSLQKDWGLMCIEDPSKVIPVDDVQVTKQLSYEEAPIVIQDRQIQRLRTKDVATVKVLWINNNVDKMTWEAEEEMNTRYPHLFPLPKEDQTKTSQPLGTYIVLDSYIGLSCLKNFLEGIKDSTDLRHFVRRKIYHAPCMISFLGPQSPTALLLSTLVPWLLQQMT